MRLLISGDRNWDDEDAIEHSIASEVQKIEVIIEGEAKGADKLARKVGERLNITVLPFPAKWTLYHQAAGPIRNKEMIVLGKPTEVWAFHNNVQESDGTLDMIFQATKAGIPTFLYSRVISIIIRKQIPFTLAKVWKKQRQEAKKNKNKLM